MTRYIFSLLLGTCFVVWAVLPVSAAWEFTTWGMSAEQVVQAPKGQARVHYLTDLQTDTIHYEPLGSKGQ